MRKNHATELEGVEDNWRKTVAALEAQVDKLSNVEAEVTRKMVDDRVRAHVCGA